MRVASAAGPVAALQEREQPPIMALRERERSCSGCSSKVSSGGGRKRLLLPPPIRRALGKMDGTGGREFEAGVVGYAGS